MESLEIFILDSNFNSLCNVDVFESFIWTDRYIGYGDFELYLSADSKVLEFAVAGNLIWLKQSVQLPSFPAGSRRYMVIEQVEITTDVENGAHLKITGRSLESILDRRIIWHQTTVSGGAQAVIKKLITDQIIAPALNERKVSNFIFNESSDPEILSHEIEEVQYLGDNLYDVILDICTLFNLGFYVVYSESEGKYIFGLHRGEDRSYSQSILPYVVFSPEFDNLVSSDYVENSIPYRNVNLVAGEVKENTDRKFVYVDRGTTPTGLDRYEMFTDGTGKQQDYKDENDQDVHLTDAQYINVLKEYALEELGKKENDIEVNFDGEMNTLQGFTYGIDFFLGDIVQIQNEYGMETTSRVTEMIISQSTSGVEMYPKFEAIKQEET